MIKIERKVTEKAQKAISSLQKAKGVKAHIILRKLMLLSWKCSMENVIYARTSKLLLIKSNTYIHIMGIWI